LNAFFLILLVGLLFVKKLQAEQVALNDRLGGLLKITPEPVIKWIDDGKVGEVNYIVTIKQME